MNSYFFHAETIYKKKKNENKLIYSFFRYLTDQKKMVIRIIKHFHKFIACMI